MTKRLTELDGLRGFAALTVVIFHYFFLYNFRYEHSISFPSWFQYGYLGVHLFFMISGFVIFWSITKCSSPLDFIWSRFSRLFPVYWVAATITFIIVSYFGLPKNTASFNDYLINLTMLQDFLWVTKVDGSYWSLAVELSFYFWILAVFFSKQLKNIEYFLIIWIITACFVANNYIGKYDPNLIHPKDPLLIIFIVKYIALFAAGICFYKVWNKTYTPLTIATLLVSALSVAISYSGVHMLIILSFYLLFGAVITGNASFFTYKPLVFLGYISYSFYLIHQYIGYVIIRQFYHFNLSPYFGILTAITFSIVLAYILTRFIERPSLKALRKLYQKYVSASLSSQKC